MYHAVGIMEYTTSKEFLYALRPFSVTSAASEDPFHLAPGAASAFQYLCTGFDPKPNYSTTKCCSASIETPSARPQGSTRRVWLAFAGLAVQACATPLPVSLKTPANPRLQTIRAGTATGFHD